MVIEKFAFRNNGSRCPIGAIIKSKFSPKHPNSPKGQKVLIIAIGLFSKTATYRDYVDSVASGHFTPRQDRTWFWAYLNLKSCLD